MCWKILCVVEGCGGGIWDCACGQPPGQLAFNLTVGSGECPMALQRMPGMQRAVPKDPLWESIGPLYNAFLLVIVFVSLPHPLDSGDRLKSPLSLNFGISSGEGVRWETTRLACPLTPRLWPKPVLGAGLAALM